MLERQQLVEKRPAFVAIAFVDAKNFFETLFGDSKRFQSRVNQIPEAVHFCFKRDALRLQFVNDPFAVLLQTTLFGDQLSIGVILFLQLDFFLFVVHV